MAVLDRTAILETSYFIMMRGSMITRRKNQERVYSVQHIKKTTAVFPGLAIFNGKSRVHLPFPLRRGFKSPLGHIFLRQKVINGSVTLPSPKAERLFSCD
jgi:hypothetical protein